MQKLRPNRMKKLNRTPGAIRHEAKEEGHFPVNLLFIFENIYRASSERRGFVSAGLMRPPHIHLALG
jgi:hypothetical protein